MKSIIKQGFIALSAASMMLSASAVAQANDCCAMELEASSSWSCGCNSSSVYYALEHMSFELSLLELLEWVNIEDVYLVNIEKALNGDIIDILNFYQTSLLQNVNVLALQHVLSNLITVAAGDDLIELSHFLNANWIDVSDIVAVDVLSDNQVVFFYW
ncbi:hypothetical protein [Chondromyces crocatus]|uniref:Uncharacterized protein n=1 Tax=Chondromyces crocatus TaxID=52 RepID=A0A0K1ER11_CHOCO|nr:hypothetical protein [Chondromyces crocatus]AKT43281.1 uncharacterized protein CMC5_075130 [Chondromyces crocatus]